MTNDYLAKLRMFDRDVRFFLITSVLLGFTIIGGIYPVLLNLYLLRLGYGPEFIGIVNATFPFVMVFFSLPSGILGQRFSTRRMMIVGLGGTVLGMGLLPLAEFVPNSWQSLWILVSYALSGLGLDLYVVNSSPFLMSSASQEERDHVFSVRSALLALAGFGGSLIGGLLPGFFAGILNISVDTPASYRYPLWIAALVLIPAVIAMLSTRDKSPQITKTSKVVTGSKPYGLITLLALVVLLQVAGEFATRTFVNVYLDSDLHLPTAQIGMLSAVGQLLAVPVALVAPLLMSRWGKERSFVATSLAMAFSLLPIALISHWAAAGFGFIAMSAFATMSRLVITVYQQEIVKPAWQPAMSGATTMTAALSAAVMAFGGGYIITAMGYRWLFLIGAAITLVGVLLFWAYPFSLHTKVDDPTT